MIPLCGIRSTKVCGSIFVQDIFYPVLPDEAAVTNCNADMVFTICSENNVVVINDLRTNDKSFLGNKTYKKRTKWTSELDTCIASVSLLKYISNFKVLHQRNLPSDHAAIALIISTVGTELDDVLMRTKSLGDYSPQYHYPPKPKLSKRPVTYGKWIMTCSMITCRSTMYPFGMTWT